MPHPPPKTRVYLAPGEYTGGVAAKCPRKSVAAEVARERFAPRVFTGG